MKKDIISVIFSNFFSAGIGFSLNVILARILSVESYGKISLIFALVATLYTLIDFGFNSSQVIYFNRERKDWTNEYRADLILRLYIDWFIKSNLIAALMIILLAVYFDLKGLEILCVFSAFFSYTLFRFSLARIQSEALWARYNRLNVLNNLIKSSCIMLALLIGYTFLEGNNYYDLTLIGYLLYPIVLILLVFIFVADKFRFNEKVSRRDYLAAKTGFSKIMLPVGMSAVTVILMMRMDVFIIEYFLGLKQLGIYAASNSLALVFPIITTSILQVFIQKSSNSNESFLASILVQQKRIAKYLPIIILFFVVLAPYIFDLLYGSEYKSGASIFSILLFAYIGGIFFTPVESYFYSHYPKRILYLRFYQLLISSCLQLVLIQTMGLFGVAIAIVVTRIFGWIYIWNLAQKVTRHV